MHFQNNPIVHPDNTGSFEIDLFTLIVSIITVLLMVVQIHQFRISKFERDKENLCRNINLKFSQNGFGVIPRLGLLTKKRLKKNPKLKSDLESFFAKREVNVVLDKEMYQSLMARISEL